MKKYWYFITKIECVLCGRIKQYKERRYTRKPADYMQRGDYRQDACDGHFV